MTDKLGLPPLPQPTGPFTKWVQEARHLDEVAAKADIRKLEAKRELKDAKLADTAARLARIRHQLDKPGPTI